MAFTGSHFQIKTQVVKVNLSNHVGSIFKYSNNEPTKCITTSDVTETS